MGRTRGGRARNVVEQRELRARADAREHGIDDLAGRRHREGELGDDDRRACALRDEADRVRAGVVAVIGDEQLVPCFELHRAQDGVDAGRRVGDEGEPLGLRADEARELLARGIDSLLELAMEEEHGFALHPRAQLGLLREHLARRRAERAVVQEAHVGVEVPVRAEGAEVGLSVHGPHRSRTGWCSCVDTVASLVCVPERWHLYVVRTNDGRLYTGIATDVERRLAEHEDGPRGAKSLRGRGPLELVYRREVGERGLALRLEHRLKRRSREEKERIVGARLSRRRLVRELLGEEAAR